MAGLVGLPAKQLHQRLLATQTTFNLYLAVEVKKNHNLGIKTGVVFL